MSALEAWKQRVAAHREQSHKIRSAMGVADQDRWEPFASFFKADPHRTDDVEVNRLAQEVTPATTLLDVGAGAGRFALPLALRCKHVTVVEPSPSMGETLRHLAAEAGIENITFVASPWHAAEVEPADVVLSAHVIYSIEDIGPFVMKLAAHARQRVCMPTFMRPPRAHYAPFWPWVHGEDKQELPGAAELVQVLWELDIYPNLEMYAPIPFRPFKDWQRALDTLRPRLFVTPDTEHDARLQQAMRELLIETSAGYVIKGIPPGRLALIAWQPASMP
jgi:2-polyprenyl-3-methyl-5-hydroxy-6-metoxy-1,4-benzoquinol methylase